MQHVLHAHAWNDTGMLQPSMQQMPQANYVQVQQNVSSMYAGGPLSQDAMKANQVRLCSAFAVQCNLLCICSGHLLFVCVSATAVVSVCVHVLCGQAVYEVHVKGTCCAAWDRHATILRTWCRLL